MLRLHLLQALVRAARRGETCTARVELVRCELLTARDLHGAATSAVNAATSAVNDDRSHLPHWSR
eukprot:5862443-Prymnesium_polylepis.2